MNKPLNAKLTAEYSELNGEAFDARSPSDRAGLFLLGAALARSVNHREIARATGLPVSEAKQLSVKAHSAGIFVGRKIAGADWCDEENGGIAFILDVLVLAGLVERIPA